MRECSYCLALSSVSDDFPSGLGELRITGLLPSITVPEGGTAQLHCTVTGNNVNIRWSR